MADAVKKLRPKDADPIQQLTVKIRASVIRDVRDVVAEMSGLPEQMTLSRFVSDALLRHLVHLRKTISPDLGQAGRGHRLRRGRPLKVVK